MEHYLSRPKSPPKAVPHTDDDQHEWSLHLNGSPAAQCSLCALLLCRLYTLQSVALITVVSHEYERASRKLIARIRCARCQAMSYHEAEYLLQPGVDMCVACDAKLPHASPEASSRLNSTSSNGASSAGSSISSSPGLSSLHSVSPSRISSLNTTRELIEIEDEDDHTGDPSSSPIEVGDSDDPSDEDVSIISMLHRQVVTNASHLKSAIHRHATDGSKQAPIDISEPERARSPIGPPPCAAAAAAAARPASAPTAAPNTAIPIPACNHALIVSPGSAPAGAPSKHAIRPNLQAARTKRTSTDGGSNMTSERPAKKKKQPATAAEASIPIGVSASLFTPAASDLASSSAAPTAASSTTPAAVRASNPTQAGGGTTGPSAATAKPTPVRRSRTEYEMTSKSGNTFAASSKGDLFSAFVRVDVNTAAQRQRALFEQSRQRLETRRMLNLEPELPPPPLPNPHGPHEPRLPYQKGARSHGTKPNMATSVPSPPPTVPFILPTFFRSENERPYTPAERLSACEVIRRAEAERRPFGALCLPNLQPATWAAHLPANEYASGAQPAAILTHHYRRLAKLVHPDKSTPEGRPASEAAFKILHAAYTQLSAIV